MPIYVDVTEVAGIGGTTGIQRVVREVTRHAMTEGVALRAPVVPVVAVGSTLYRLDTRGLRYLDAPAHDAQRLTASGIGTALKDAMRRHVIIAFMIARKISFRRHMRSIIQGCADAVPVAPGTGDTLVLIDTFWNGSTVLDAAQRAKRRGAKILLVIYDLFPIRQRKQVDPLAAYIFPRLVHRAVALADGVLTISKQVTADVLDYFGSALPASRIRHFYLGQDCPTRAEDIQNAGLPTPFLMPTGYRYLMVGTLEPRRGHAYVLDAFDRLWGNGGEQQLMLIGKIGWMMDDVIARCRAHPRFGSQLFLLHDASDAAVAAAVASCDAVIMASYFEGFGLPLIEALLAGKPVIASDIPIFQEIAGDTPLFFRCGDSNALADALRDFELAPDTWRVRAAAFSWLDWSESSRMFLAEMADLLETR